MVVLQNNIETIKPYFRSLETYNEALIIRVQYPAKWAVFPSDDGRIKVAPSDQTAYEYFYYGDGGHVSLDDIFNFIKETIEVNESLEEKAKLLAQRAKELQELFETTPLERLKTLKFVMDEAKNTKTKRKYTRRKKDQENAKEEPSDKSEEAEINKETIVKEERDTEDNASCETTEKVSEIKVSSSTLSKFKKVKNKKETE